MADYILDRFTASDDTLIHGRTAETGETWTAQVSAMKVASNRAICSVDGTRAICTLPTSWANVSVEVNLRSANIEAGVAGIVLRWTDANNYWLFRMYSTGGNKFRLYEINGGAETLRVFDNPAFNVTDDIKVRAVANGSTITVTATQGATSLQIQYASATHNQSATTHGIMLEQIEDSVNDVLVWSGAGAPPANPLYTAITLTTPASLQVFQRSGTTGDIAIAGTFSGGGTHDIEASFNGGAYETIDEDASGTFSGTLASQAQGQGTVTVRFVDDPGVTATATYVGIGDVYVLAGQSNMSGRGTAAQSWSHATLHAAQLGNNYNWAELAAINDSNVAQVDAVSSDADAAQNYIPRLATAIMADQSVPVAFIPCALGGAAIVSWLPGANHQDRTTLYGSMVYRALQAGSVKAVLFHQGESDATVNGFTGGATYKSRLKTFADAVWADLAAPVVVCRIHCWSGAPDTSQANIDEINAAMASAALENSHVLLGPNFDSPTPVTTSLHFTSDAEMIDAAARFWSALNRLFYTVAVGTTEPQIRLATVPDYWPLDAYYPFAAQTLDDGGEIADVDGSPYYSVWNMATGNVVATGSMAAVADTVGLYMARVQLTTAAGFVSGESYVLRVCAVMSDKFVSDLAVFLTGVASANVTMQAGVAVAAADANGNVPAVVKAWYDTPVPEPDTAGYPDIGTLAYVSSQVSQQIRDAMKLAPTAGAAAAGSIDAHLDDILEDTGTTLPSLLSSTVAGSNDVTTAGSITRKRGNSWSIALTLGAITGYTSLWFTAKLNTEDADTAAIIQIKKNASGSGDGLLYVNGAAPTSAALGSITVSDATTGAIIVALDETITDDLTPDAYYYDCQVLISGNVTTPETGTLTVTADVTRSVA